MPQLNPAPWLMIMLISWLVLLLLLNPKVTTISSQNPTLMNNQTHHKTSPWSWPWT